MRSPVPSGSVLAMKHGRTCLNAGRAAASSTVMYVRSAALTTRDSAALLRQRPWWWQRTTISWPKFEVLAPPRFEQDAASVQNVGRFWEAEASGKLCGITQDLLRQTALLTDPSTRIRPGSIPP